MGVGALVGVFLIVREFAGVDDLWSTLASAEWSWVCVAFVLAQLTNVAQAVSVLGSVSTPLPFGPTIGLELANAFTGLVAGTVGTTATIIRYFQRRGLAVSVAVSSGVLVQPGQHGRAGGAVRGRRSWSPDRRSATRSTRLVGERQQLVGLGHDLAAGAPRGRPGRRRQR